MYFGQRLRRREDQRFLTGNGQYSDDFMVPDMAYAAFVRSPHAHANILSLSTDKAAATQGVLRVLTAEDWHADGNGELVCVHPMPFSEGRPMNEKLKPVLAHGKVCHVGDAVACVIAETRFAAMDGAEAVAVEYQELPNVWRALKEAGAA